MAAGSSELSALQDSLDAKRALCAKLRRHTDAARQELAATRASCKAGIEAARIQMTRMQAELGAARQLQALAAEKASAEPAPPASATAAESPGGEDEGLDAAQARRRSLQIQARGLRHELSKWKHQVEVLEAQRPIEEDEMARLKAQLLHTADVLDSTREAARHAEVDRDLAAAGMGRDALALVAVGGESVESGSAPGFKQEAPRVNIDAQTERTIRERTEEKNWMLQDKAKRLSSVASAQQMLIHRLEKQVVQEESSFERKAEQLAHEAQRHALLKGAWRRRADAAVAEALGWGPARPRRAAAGRSASASPTGPASTASPGAGGASRSGLSESASAPHLPPIAA